jgi:hypothetical protein
MWMLELAQDWSAIKIMKQVVIVVGLIREPSVINKDIVDLLVVLWFIRYMHMGIGTMAGGGFALVPKVEHVEGFNHDFLWYMKNKDVG